MRANVIPGLKLPLTSGLALVVCGLLFQGTSAQVQGPQALADPPDSRLTAGERIKIDVEMALANVTVTDSHDRFITGLEKDNFRVFENGVEQEIVNVSSEDAPISVGLIVDLSGSMSNKLEEVRQAAIAFFHTANPRDEFFMISFNDSAQLVSKFGSSVEELQNNMLYMQAKGRTALLDGIYLGLSQMSHANNAKRALLVVSDGGDNHSRYSEKSIRAFLKEADCQLYAIGVFNSGDMGRSIEERYGPTLLAELTEMTGGRLFSIEHPRDLPDVAEHIGLELRNQYVVGYRPSNTAHDGAWRKIKVGLSLPKNLPPLFIHAKTGYYAPGY